MRIISLMFVFVLLLHGVAIAQDEPVENPSLMKFSLHGGVSLPQGDFSSTSGTKAGLSSTGFCVMLEGSKILNPDVSWTTGVSVNVNAINEEELRKQVSPISVTAGSYVTTWAMTGIKFTAQTSEKAGIYVLGQCGLLFSSFPDVTFSYGGQSVTQTASLATAFAYGFGAGLQLEKVNIGLRYYTGEPEYNQSASGNGVSQTAKAKLPATVLQLMMGVNL